MLTYMVRSLEGGATWSERTLIDAAGGRSQWFPWADHKPDGTLVVAWDEDTAPAPADTFVHVLWRDGVGRETLGADENVDVSATHWSGQYVPQSRRPAAGCVLAPRITFRVVLRRGALLDGRPPDFRYRRNQGDGLLLLACRPGGGLRGAPVGV